MFCPSRCHHVLRSFAPVFGARARRTLAEAAALPIHLTASLRLSSAAFRPAATCFSQSGLTLPGCAPPGPPGLSGAL
jgi:hypothetical protein